jgi:hypothetical protein
MADERAQQFLETIQIYHPTVDLSRIRYSAHGQFIHNLQLVLENDGPWRVFDPDRLRTTSKTIERISEGRGFLLSRAGIVVDHFHLTIGCAVDDAPEEVAMAFLNELAFEFGMREVFRFGFYAGTFGNYDLNAVRS